MRKNEEKRLFYNNKWIITKVIIYLYKRVISKIFRRMDFSLLFPLKVYNRNLAKIKVNELRLIIIANNL